MATDSVGALVSEVSFRATNDATADTELKARIKFTLGQVLYGVVAEIDLQHFRAEGTITTVVGTADYALAEDLMRLIDPGVRMDQTPYKPLLHLDQEEYDLRRFKQWHSSNGEPVWYMFLGTDIATGRKKIRSVPTPDAVYSLVYSYLARPEDPGEADDEAVIDRRFPREHLQLLVHGTVMGMPQYMDSGQVQNAREEYALGLERLRRHNEAISAPARTRGLWPHGSNARLDPYGIQPGSHPTDPVW